VSFHKFFCFLDGWFTCPTFNFDYNIINSEIREVTSSLRTLVFRLDFIVDIVVLEKEC
jgi:hypothetical protein